MTGVPGTELDSESAAAFRRIQPGAFILFGRNIKTAPQLRKLIDDLRELSDIEPIITIDQEGGRVSRLRMLGKKHLTFSYSIKMGNLSASAICFPTRRVPS